MNPTEGTEREESAEDETIQRHESIVNSIQPQISTGTKKIKPRVTFVEQPELKKPENKKTGINKTSKKKPPTVAPINKMVSPYTPQQFFDQPANITNGQLLAMNPKFGLTIAKQLKKPVARKKTDKMDEDEVPSEPESKSNFSSNPNSDKSSALYCEASIKNIKFPLIVDSGSAGSIISLRLLKDLDMEITQASKTVMVNVNGERRRPLGAVTDIPLSIQGLVIPMDAIVTDADSYAAIIGNDWLRKTKANIDYDSNVLTLKWHKHILQVPTECQEMPHHIISIEVPDMESEKEDEEEEEDKDEDDDDEEYEVEEDLQESLYCQTQYITRNMPNVLKTNSKMKPLPRKSVTTNTKKQRKESFIWVVLMKNKNESSKNLWNDIKISSSGIMILLVVLP